MNPAPFCLIGIVNVTPDSFSDGGKYIDPRNAVAHGLRLLDEGAGMLDLGAESTRPFAEPVPEGEVGELVLTTINREAMPLLRYRTRDLTRILPGECPCGRHHKRLDRMKGRSDDMMILKGVNIFPIQIETVLMQFEELGNNYLITLTNEEANDLMTVEVELNEFSDDYPKLQALTKEITRQLKDEILLTPLVKLVPKGSLPQQDGKAVRVRDLRKTLI